MSPSYDSMTDEEWRDRVSRACKELRDCRLCARDCGVNRREGELGFCRTGNRAVVSSHGPHPGEEAPLSGSRGSGTIFFAGCNLRCIYCQNYETSHYMLGREVSVSELGDIMLSLQRRGCHNINLVSPSHIIPQIIAALARAAARGLHLPVVYNTGGFDSLRGLELLDGLVDIYMPDLKYQDSNVAEELSGTRDYPEINRAAILEMHRQVGDLVLDGRGLAVSGLLVRHLVLPGDLAGTEKAFEFLAEDVSPDTFVNIMAQYYPAYRAREHALLGRRLTASEFRAAVKAAEDAGLTRAQRR